MVPGFVFDMGPSGASVFSSAHVDMDILVLEAE